MGNQSTVGHGMPQVRSSPSTSKRKWESAMKAPGKRAQAGGTKRFLGRAIRWHEGICAPSRSVVIPVTDNSPSDSEHDSGAVGYLSFPTAYWHPAPAVDYQSPENTRGAAS